MDYSNDYKERVFDNLTLYLDEALVLGEISTEQHKTMIQQPLKGIDWLWSTKGIDVTRENS